ncbi:MAG: hypothetical protein ACRC10_00930 [Thermoguttaceae bacterium]
MLEFKQICFPVWSKGQPIDRERVEMVGLLFAAVRDRSVPGLVRTDSIYQKEDRGFLVYSQFHYRGGADLYDVYICKDCETFEGALVEVSARKGLELFVKIVEYSGDSTLIQIDIVSRTKIGG